MQAEFLANNTANNWLSSPIAGKGKQRELVDIEFALSLRTHAAGSKSLRNARSIVFTFRSTCKSRVAFTAEVAGGYVFL